jgi:hypothetical protein
MLAQLPSLPHFSLYNPYIFLFWIAYREVGYAFPVLEFSGT